MVFNLRRYDDNQIDDMKAKNALEKEILQGIQAYGYVQFMNALRETIERRAKEGKASPKAQEKLDLLQADWLGGNQNFPISISIHETIE